MSLPNRQFANFHVISLPERLDQQQSAQVWDELKPMLNPSQRNVLLDMAQISRLDWNGVTLLMDVFAQIRRYSGTLAMMQVHPVVMAFLELTQTNHLIPVFTDEAAALTGFRN